MHDPTSHHHPVRMAVAVAPSLLRASVMQRVAIATLFAAILWLAVGWGLDLWTTGAAQ
jgi:hypothetical protein